MPSNLYRLRQTTKNGIDTKVRGEKVAEITGVAYRYKKYDLKGNY
ncbi:hypothetical protein H0910_18680 [Providencia alcalifaciens]|nr:hypothetical protein [Providencia alcalifaciens]